MAVTEGKFESLARRHAPSSVESAYCGSGAESSGTDSNTGPRLSVRELSWLLVVYVRAGTPGPAETYEAHAILSR